MKTKQVILVRKDLNMRKGKMIAQGSHASMKVILNIMRKYKTSNKTTVYNLELGEDSVLNNWLEGKFTKVCLGVNSKDELLDFFNKASNLSIPCSLIIDSGLTEFNGVPTETCVAIGPYYSEEIDKITGNLKLL